MGEGGGVEGCKQAAATRPVDCSSGSAAAGACVCHLDVEPKTRSTAQKMDSNFSIWMMTHIFIF